MAERALPDLVSRISIDAAPLNAAASGIAGIFGGLASRAESEGQKMEGSFNRVSGVMAGVGIGVAGAAAAIGANAIKMASDFDASARQLAGSAQIPVSSAQAIADSFLHSGEVTTFSAQEMVSALAPVSGQLELLSGHALTTAEAHKIMSAAAELAEASHTDLGSATKVLSSVMVAYKIPLNEADDATNSLFNTSRAVNVPLDELQSALAKIHARLGDVSPGLNDTNTLMVDLAINGITGSRAVTAASSAFLTLLGSSKPVTDELSKLNVHLYDAHGNFIGMEAVIGQLQKAEAGMTTQQKDQTNSILFGTKASQEMSSVVSGGTKTWEEAGRTVQTAGAAHKAAGDAMGGAEGQGKILKKNIDDLQVSIGKGLTPALNEILKALNPVVDKMAKWAADHKNETTAILAIAAALGTLAIAVWAVNIAIQANPVIIVVEAVLILLGAMAWATYQVVTHWNDMSFTMKGWAAVAWIVMANNPITGGFIAILSAIVTVHSHWKQLTDFLGSTWKTISSDVAGVVKGIVDWFNSLPGALQAALLRIPIVSFFYGLYQQLVGGSIVPDIIHGIASWFGALPGMLLGALGGLVGVVVGHLVQLYNTFYSYWLLIWAFVGAILGAIVNTIAGWLGAAYNFIVGHLVQAYTTFLTYWFLISAFVGAILGAIVNTISGWLGAAYNFIVGHLVQAYTTFLTYWFLISAFVGSILGAIWGTISFWLTAAWNTIVSILTTIWNFFVSIWTTVWNFVTGVWTGIWNTISYWITTVYNTIVQWFTNAWNFISNLWTTIWNWLVATWTGIWNSVGQFFGNIYNTISDWTTRTWQRLSEGWNYIKDGLGSLVKGIVDDIWTKFHEGLNAVIKIINDFLGAVDSVLTNSPLHITVLNGVRIPPFEGGGVIGGAAVGPVGGAFESGGLIPGFCAGGCPPGGCGHGMGGAAVRGVGAGFKTTEPTFIRALTGEGQAPEYVIPTEGRYRANAAALWHQAGEELGLLAGQVPGFNIAHIRHESGGILGLAVGGSIPTSGAGGQCLAFVCQTSGIGCGYPAAADAAALCNSGTIKAGDVFITTEPPFGHAGYVLDANTALDSNFHLDEQIHEHPMADIYGLGPICFIDPGAPFGGASPSGGGGIGSAITSIIRSAVQALFGPFEGAIGAVPGLPGVIGKGLVKSLEDGVLSLIPVISPSGPQSAAANACQVVDWAKQGGFSGQAMYNAAAIALAESSGNPDPNSTFTSDVNGGTYGLMQFNQAEWAQWGAKYGSIGDPVAQMRAAFDYSRGGSFFDPWCTSTAAMNASGIGGCGGAGGATAGKFLAAVEACKEMGGVLPTDAYSFDQGGRWRTGTWGYNGSGHDELVLNKEQQRGLGGGDEVLEVLQRIEQKVMGHLEVNTYGTNLTPRDVAREIVQEVRAI